MDRLTLVRTLTDLTPADLATLIAMIPGAVGNSAASQSRSRPAS